MIEPVYMHSGPKYRQIILTNEQVFRKGLLRDMMEKGLHVVNVHESKHKYYILDIKRDEQFNFRQYPEYNRVMIDGYKCKMTIEEVIDYAERNNLHTQRTGSE